MTTSLHIALDADIVDELRPRILAIAPDAALVSITHDGQVHGDAGQVTVYLRSRWLARMEAVLDLMPRLRWLHTNSTGVDHVLTPALIASDVVVTNSAGAHAIPIAESVMGMLTAIVKRLPDHWRNQQASRWERYRKDELLGQTLLIVGTGHIGRETARRARAFGMTSIGVTATPRDEPLFDRLLPYADLVEALPQADFVLLAAALTPATRRLIGVAELRRMKPTAWLLNVARGEMVDEAALLDALREEVIAGAYLDVFSQEPLPADHPLWTAPRVLIIPHNTAFTWQSRGRSLDLFLDNLGRWVAGEPLVNVVDKARGY